MFGIEVAEVEEPRCWSANVGVMAAVSILEIFAVILLINGSINVLMSEELEDEWQVIRV